MGINWPFRWLDSFGKSIQPGLHAPPCTGLAPRIKAAPTRQNCPLPRTFFQFCLFVSHICQAYGSHNMDNIHWNVICSFEVPTDKDLMLHIQAKYDDRELIC